MFRKEKCLIVACVLYLLSCTLYFPAITSAQDEKVVERYKLMLSRNPKEGSTFDRLYQLYLEDAGLDTMVADYQAEAEAKPNDSNLQLILGHIHKRLGKDAETLTAYQRAVELAPNNYYPHFALGQMYATLRRHEDAIRELTKAAELSEQTQAASPEELMTIYKALGRAYFSRDRVDEAISAWQKSLNWIQKTSFPVLNSQTSSENNNSTNKPSRNMKRLSHLKPTIHIASA